MPYLTASLNWNKRSSVLITSKPLSTIEFIDKWTLYRPIVTLKTLDYSSFRDEFMSSKDSLDFLKKSSRDSNIYFKLCL